MSTVIYSAILTCLALFAFYQVVRQDDRLDKARGPVRFLLILFILEQLVLAVFLAQNSG